MFTGLPFSPHPRALGRGLLVGLCLLLLAVPAFAQQTVPETVRVRLFEEQQPRLIEVAATRGRTLLYAGDADAPLATLEAGDAIRVGRRSHELHVQLDEYAFYALDLVARAEAGTPLRVEVVDGATLAGGHYPGALRLDVTGSVLRCINVAPMDDYVASVVTHEYGFDDVEGNKAMAVLARTYAVRTLQERSADYDLVDHIGAQVYRGMEDLNPMAVEATRSTRGQILTYRNRPVEAVYFASSGGHTADNDAVWDARPLAYLRGQPDPFDAVAPYQDWRAFVPRDRLLRILSDTYHMPVEGFLLHGRSADGRVEKIRLLGPRERIISSNAFRLLVNRHFGETHLRSTFFDARREGNRYVFEGKGYGHGVGLSQWGAHAMAEEGYDYRDILAFYYDGVALHPEGTLASPVLADGTRPPDTTATPARSNAEPQGRTPTSSPRTKRRIGW
jgi:stage II sporulation protein D